VTVSSPLRGTQIGYTILYEVYLVLTTFAIYLYFRLQKTVIVKTFISKLFHFMSSKLIGGFYMEAKFGFSPCGKNKDLRAFQEKILRRGISTRLTNEIH